SSRGTVVGGGEAVANAKISAYAIESEKETIARVVANRPRVLLATTMSAADGAFTLPIDSAGCVAVHVEAATFAPSFTEAVVGNGDVLISLAPKRSGQITLRSPAGPLARPRTAPSRSIARRGTTASYRRRPATSAARSAKPPPGPSSGSCRAPR